MGFVVGKEYMFKDEQSFDDMMNNLRGWVDIGTIQFYKALRLNSFRVLSTDVHGNALAIMQGHTMFEAHKIKRTYMFSANDLQYFVECPTLIEKVEGEPETIDEMLKEFEKLDAKIKDLSAKRDKLKAKLNDKLNDADVLIGRNQMAYRGATL